MDGSRLCGRCLRKAPAFDSSWALFSYQPPIDSLIRGLKFHGDLVAARALGLLLANHLPLQPRPEVIIPVPLHVTRLRQRGYNQSVELARWISRSWHIPLASQACCRQRATSEQSRLKLSERRRNIRGAFKVNAAFKARHVALVDDVMTTGWTLAELARVLKQSGVQTVSVWTCARAQPLR